VPARNPSRRLAHCLLLGLALPLLPLGGIGAQDRLKQMPGYDQWAAMAPKLQGAIKSGAITPQWADDSRTFEYLFDGKRWTYDVATRRSGRSRARPPVDRGLVRRLAAQGDL
jgi:hypothetical protein